MANSTRNTKGIIVDTIKELFADDKFIESLMQKIERIVEKKVNDKIKHLEDKIIKNEENINMLVEKMENFYQNTKLDNICVYGLFEEKQENLAKKINEQFTQKMNVTLPPDGIVYYQRVGKISEGKIRPVIIKLKNYDAKKLIMKNVHKLKGTKMYITDDLIQSRRNILQEAQDKLKNKKVWCFNGNIFVKINNENFKITNSNAINNLI